MRSRTLALWLLGCAAIAALVRVCAYDVDPLRRLDLRVLGRLGVEPWSAEHDLANAITAPFQAAPFAVILVIVAGIAFAGGRPRAGVAAAGVMLGSAVTTQLLKSVLAEPRPSPQWQPVASDAWPSGHTTAAIGVVAAVLLVTPPGRRGPIAAVGAVLVVAVAWALMALGWHFPSDIAGGACVATAWAAVGFWVTDRTRTPA